MDATYGNNIRNCNTQKKKSQKSIVVVYRPNTNNDEKVSNKNKFRETRSKVKDAAENFM